MVKDISCRLKCCDDMGLLVLGPHHFCSINPLKGKYSVAPQYKFSFDYPQNQTMIKDPVVSTDITDITFGTNISAESVNFSVYVKESTMDPQEFLVTYTQHLPCNFMAIEGGVKSIIIDENGLGISTVLQIV
jgi:hypothetical protein